MFSPRHSDYEKYRSLRGAIVTLEGCIGAGKSTAGRSMEEYLNRIGIKARFFPEYKNELLLGQYIKDMRKYAYSFQLLMLAKRIAIYGEAGRYAKKGGVAIIDRSLLGDMTFARMQWRSGFFTDEEWTVYINSMVSEIQLEPTAILFLDCTPETSLHRIQKRGIVEEIAGYNIDYLQALHEAYVESLHKTSARSILVNYDGDSVLSNDGNLPDPMTKQLLNCVLTIAAENDVDS